MLKQNNQIRLFKPSFDNEEIKSIKGVFKSPWLGYGSKVKEFENKFSKFLGSKFAIGLNSCTAALHLSLAVNRFKRKKKVLVPVMTFSATAAAILYNDLEPVFVDINSHNLNLNFEDLKRKYSKDCVALMAVHFGGHPCEMDKITSWAKRKKLIVIEDCAHTCGGEFKGRKLGTWGDFGCYSFEDKKIISTGDGGSLCSKSKKNFNLLKSISFHGWSKDPWERHLKRGKINHWYYQVKNLGFKYNMTNLIASIAIPQLKKLKKFNKIRIKLLNRYLVELKDLKHFKFAIDYKLKNSCYWLFILKTKKRDTFINFLKSKGISSTVHLMPLNYHPLYKKYKAKTPISNQIWKELVSLPLFIDMKKSQLDYIVKIIKQFDNNYNNY